MTSIIYYPILHFQSVNLIIYETKIVRGGKSSVVIRIILLFIEED